MKKLVFILIFILCLSSVMAYTPIPKPEIDGLVAGWHLNQTSGTVAVDYSINEKNLSGAGTPDWWSNSSCQFDKCVYLANGELFTYSTDLYFTNNSGSLYVYEGWFRPDEDIDSLTTDQGLIGNFKTSGTQAGCMVFLDQGTDRIQIACKNTGGVTITQYCTKTGDWVAGQMYHGYFEIDKTNTDDVICLIDGVDYSAGSPIGGVVQNGTGPNFKFGARSDNTADFIGVLDDWAVYNVSLLNDSKEMSCDDTSTLGNGTTGWCYEGVADTPPTISLGSPPAETIYSSYVTEINISATYDDANNESGELRLYLDTVNGTTLVQTNTSLEPGTTVYYTATITNNTQYFWSGDVNNTNHTTPVESETRNFTVADRTLDTVPTLVQGEPFNNVWFDNTLRPYDSGADFEYTITDVDSVVNCSVYDNSTGSWALHDTQFTNLEGANSVTANFGNVDNVIWNVNCEIGNGSTYWVGALNRTAHFNADAKLFRGIYYQLYGVKYDTPAATFSSKNRPMGKKVGDYSYFVFGGENENPYISAYNHSSGRFLDSVKVADAPLSADGHGNPTLNVDNDGFLYVWYGSHNTAQKTKRSINANDITAWDTEVSTGSAYTYPQPFTKDDGTLISFIRTGTSTSSEENYITSTNNGASYSGATKITDYADQGVYMIVTPQRTDNDAFLMTWGLVLNSTNRKHVYYGFMNDTGLFELDGTQCTKFNETCGELVFNSSALDTRTGELTSDSDGNPIILFQTTEGDEDDSVAPNKWFVEYYNGTDWILHNVSNSCIGDHNYDRGTLRWFADDDVRVYIPCEVSQPDEDGGEVVEFQITDLEGGSFTRIKNVTVNSTISHNYMKPIIGGSSEFDVFWGYDNSTSRGGTELTQDTGYMYYWGRDVVNPTMIFYDNSSVDTCSNFVTTGVLNCGDNCVFSSNVSISGNVSITGAGTLTWGADVYWLFSGSNQFVTTKASGAAGCFKVNKAFIS